MSVTEYPWLKSLPAGPPTPPKGVLSAEVVPVEWPCDVCQGRGWLKDEISPTGRTDCPMCHGSRTNDWREDVARSKHHRLQVRQVGRLLLWVAIAFLWFVPFEVKGMWLAEIWLGLIFLKFILWGVRQNNNRAKGSLT